MQNNGADAAWYGYDFREQRVWRRLFNGGSSTEIHYIFDQGGHLLAEHNGYTGAVLREYVWADDMPVAVIDKTSGTAVTYFIHNGHLNEPQMMTDASKAKVWDAYVTPFGSAKVFTTASANVDIRLPGQWFQAEAAGSGLNQNHHRDYDPSLGRYIQVDPIGLNGGQNPYAYVDGMVFDVTDPLGLVPEFMVPKEVKKNTRNVVQKICGGAFTPKELDDISKQVISNISLSDALKFKDINPSSSPIKVTKEQKKIVDDLINRLKNDATGNKAKSEYAKAVKTGKVVVK